MNIYNAIMAAANRIEAYPEKFDFWNNDIPQSCGSPGCALGWIGFYLGLRDKRSHAQSVVSRVLGTDAASFYQSLTDLCGDRSWFGPADWKKNPAVCAKVLRLYAEEYHAHEIMGEKITEDA
jgi:hypothetical protein